MEPIAPFLHVTAAPTEGKHEGLDAIFAPKSVAVIGATEREGSVGRTVFWNLIRSPFGGPVYPVNPGRRSVLGVRAYHSLSDVPERLDLVVITTPAATVPDLIEECVVCGVRGVIVISAGFRETGPVSTARFLRKRFTSDTFIPRNSAAA